MDFGANRTFSQKLNPIIREGVNTHTIGDLNNYDFLDVHRKYVELVSKHTTDIEDFKMVFESLSYICAAVHDKYCSTILEGVDMEEKERRWKEYRLEDCMSVCSQETERIVRCLECNPNKEALREKSVMELEQQFGIWQPYLSDDSDDEDYSEPEEQSSEEETQAKGRKKRVISLSDDESSDGDVEIIY